MIAQLTVEALVSQCMEEIHALKTRQDVDAALAILYGAEATNTTYDTSVVVSAATVSSNSYKRILYTYSHPGAEDPIVQPRVTWSSDHGFFYLYIPHVATTDPTTSQFMVVIENYLVDPLNISIKAIVNASAPGTLSYTIL
jgi:hypothetical protein